MSREADPEQNTKELLEEIQEITKERDALRQGLQEAKEIIDYVLRFS